MAKKQKTNTDAKVVRGPHWRRQKRAERWLRRKKIRTGELESQVVARSKERQQKEREEKRVERERVSKALYEAELELIHKEYLKRQEQRESGLTSENELRQTPFKDVFEGLSNES